MTKGRTTEQRTETITTTSGSVTITGAASPLDRTDIDRGITGPGIPASSTIAAVSSTTTATLSANATASATVPVTIATTTATALGFTGWSPESGAEADSYTVSAVTAGTAAPDKITGTITAVEQRARG
jgi:hypothetical protein